MCKYFSGLIVLFVLLSVFACSVFSYENNPTVQNYLKLLKDNGYHYQSYGAILEVLVRESLKERFNTSDYEITGGLELISDRGFAIGEIDILVLRKIDNKVMLIGEAKIWRDLAKGLQKAESQLAKLRDSIENGKVKKLFFVPNPERTFDISIFDGKILYETFSSAGGKNIGFDYELPITIEQGNYLIDKLDRWHYGQAGCDSDERLQNYLSYLKSNLKVKRIDEKLIMKELLKKTFADEYPEINLKFYDDLGYYNENNEKIGQLSLVGVDIKTNKAVFACARPFGRNDLASAFNVSQAFMNEYNSAKAENKIAYYQVYKGETVNKEVFSGVFRQEIVNLKGSKKFGFTKELDLTDDEAHYLVLKLSKKL